MKSRRYSRRGLEATYAIVFFDAIRVKIRNEGMVNGCPNSCSRPPTAEIGIIGYGKNDYVLLVGGARDGSRLARVLYPRLGERELIEALKSLVRAIRDRNPHRLPAGDYLDQTPDAELKAHHAG